MNLYHVVIVSAVLSLIFTRIFITDFYKRGKVVKDYYKPDLPDIPTGGGFGIVFSVYLTILIFRILGGNFEEQLLDFISATIVTVFGLFGVLDDVIDIGRPVKIFLPVAFSLPLFLFYNPYPVQLPLVGVIDDIIPFIIVPVYVMVVANLVNMHSGFNGLASGLSTILLAFLFIKAVMTDTENLVFIAAVLGATAGFFWFERYPSKIFLGNIGSMLVGSAVGIGIVTTGYYIAGFVMLIPHTVNFLMYAYWRIRHILNPEDKRWKKVKFGRVREDWTLEVPNPLTLKWVLPYYYRMKEWQVVLCMYALTILFCIIALFIPY